MTTFLNNRRYTLLLLGFFLLSVSLAFSAKPSGNNGGRSSAAQNSAKGKAAEDNAKAPPKRPSNSKKSEKSTPKVTNKPTSAKPTQSRKKQASSPSIGEFSLNIDRTARMLRIHPEGKGDRQDLNVAINSEFSTEISFDNQALLPFTGVRVFLSYENDFLEPISINDNPISSYIKGNPTAEVDPMFGLLLYEAQLKEPLALNNTPILSVKWKAKETTRETRIEFGSRDDTFTALLNEDQDILGNPKDPSDGTLNMTVKVLPEDPREAEAFLNDPMLFANEGAKVGGIKFSMIPPSESIVVGEPFHVDLMIDNKAFSNIDNLEILLTFDPSILQLLDADKDNYITLRSNILDGPFHDEFPWNFHVDNSIYQTRGIVSYRVGSDNPDFIRGKTGVFARIYAVAKRPTAGTPLVFRFSKKARVSGTKATFNGQDALGDSTVFGDGTKGLLLTVLPKETTTTNNDQ